MQIRLFEFLLPKLWRTRTPADPERNDAALARVQDTDAVYRAVMDHAHQALENAMVAALQPKVNPTEREFLCGQASSLAQFIANVESTRERARMLAEQEQRRRAARTRAGV